MDFSTWVFHCFIVLATNHENSDRKPKVHKLAKFKEVDSVAHDSFNAGCLPRNAEIRGNDTILMLKGISIRPYSNTITSQARTAMPTRKRSEGEAKTSNESMRKLQPQR